LYHSLTLEDKAKSSLSVHSSVLLNIQISAMRYEACVSRTVVQTTRLASQTKKLPIAQGARAFNLYASMQPIYRTDVPLHPRIRFLYI